MNFETRILLNRELRNAKTRKRDLRRETRFETRKKVHDKIFETRKSIFAFSRFRVFAFFNREVHHNNVKHVAPICILPYPFTYFTIKSQSEIKHKSMFYFYFYRNKLGVQKIYLKILKLGWSVSSGCPCLWGLEKE